MLAGALAGCGFHRTSPDDGGAPAATDLAGSDGGGGSTGGTGAGPLGALPAGVCCSSNDDCRSRNCTGLFLPVHYCTDECDHDSLCSVWGGSLACDTSSGTCVATTTPATCLDPALYHYGTKPLGSCCQSGFDKSGQECLGGRCAATGPASNPFYCTQGCDPSTPCPAPYVCNSASFCSLPDPNAPYQCN